jgi:hypothetical protein
LTERIQFTIEKTELLEYSNESQLIKVRMWIVREGNNLHKLPISWDCIEKAKDTLVGKPVLCKYNKVTRSFEGHDKDEIPVGVFLNKSEIYEEVISDQKWLVADAYIWKAYFPHVVEVFEDNDGQSAISMEIEILEFHDDEFETQHIDAFAFLGVTLIGLTPAMPNAKAVVLNFSTLVEETRTILAEEFSSRYSQLNFKIPSLVKQNAKEGLDLYKKHGKGGTSVSLSIARFLSNNEIATPEKTKQVAKKLSRFTGSLEDKESSDWVSWQLHGGNSGKSWATKLVERMDELDKAKVSYFNGDDIGSDDGENQDKEVNNSMDEENDEMKHKDEHDEHKEDMAVEKPEDKEETPETNDEEKKEEMAADTEETSETEKKEEETQENMEAEKEDEKDETSTEVVYDVNTLLAMLEDEKQKCMAKDEKCKAFALENEELKKFKNSVEHERFCFEVDKILAEVKEDLSKDDYESLMEKSQKYSLATIEDLRTFARSEAYNSTKGKKKNDDGIVRYDLSWNTGKNDKKSIWD